MMKHTHKWLRALLLVAGIAQAGSALATTLAYWRFEGDDTKTPVAGSQMEDSKGRTTASTGVGIRVKDVTGNGNDMWSWAYAWAGYNYQTPVPAAKIPQTGQSNGFSVKNAGSYPAIFTWSKYSTPKLDIETLTPRSWTIEASINMTSTGGYQTFVGRDGYGAYAGDKAAAPLYFQAVNGTLTIKFADMAGHFYTATDTSGAMTAGKWYNVAAVSDGATLRLYRDSGTGYALVGSAALTAGDTRLAYASNPSTTAGDAQWGWTLGRGRYSTATGQGDGHSDRFMGYIDEVRISDVALGSNQFLFSSPAIPDTRTQAGTVNLAVVPDIQEYSRYKPEILNAQTRWIADNASRLGIVFTLQLGDIVDQQWVTSQWTAADAGMAILETAGKPYAILPGNHDVYNSGYWDSGRASWQEPFLKYFGPTRALRNTATFGGRDPLGYSEYHVVEAQGQRFLVLALGWNSTTQTLAWAQNVIRTLNLPTIVMTHEALDVATDEVSAVWTDYGNYLWANLVSNNNQIFMMINGHHHGTARTFRANAAGNPVLSMVMDYQSDYQGGNGYMRLLQLDIANGKVNSIDFSPWVLAKIAKGEALAYPDDAKRDGAQQSFMVDYDLAARIATITDKAPSYTVGVDQVDAIAVLDAELSTAPAAPELSYTDALSDGDYKVNADTLAHWRFDGFASGEPVPAGMPLSLDISGNGNDLMRVDVGSPADNALVFSSDSHPGSASHGSVCLAGGGRSARAGAYLQTMEGNTVALDPFTGGYTFEAFFKLSGNFDATYDRWTGIIARAETGAEVGKTDGDSSESAAGLNISDIREIQWAVYPSNMSSMETSWSFAVPRSTWHHVAAVNDGKTIKVYVDGITDMRNATATNAAGLAAASGLGWMIGASHYNHSPYVFNGCIGEVRVTRRALAPSEFLYQRN